MQGGTMQLARVHGPRDVRLDEVPVPAAGPGEVIVRVGACGICGSDLGYIAQGSLGGGPLAEPLAIGHEFAGTVAAVGDGVADVPVGLRVAVNPDSGMIGGGAREGAMAPFIRVVDPRLGHTLFALPDHVSFAEASLCEPLSVALHALRVARVAAQDKVAVLGAGPIGLCSLVMLRSMGVQQIAVFDREASRLERARALGAAFTGNVAEEPLGAALARFHGAGERFGAPCVGTQVFIDCAGVPAALTEALALAPYRARFAIVALYKQPVALDLWRMMANEITMSGSIADNRPGEFGEALDLIAQGRIDLSPLISHRVDFADFHQALAKAGDPAQSAKVVLTFGEPA